MNDDANIPEFEKIYGTNFPVGRVDRMAAGAAMELSPMMRAYVPFMLIIDRNGMVQAQFTGGDPFLANEAEQDKNIREEVGKLLSQPKPPVKRTGTQKK
jgi:hypothetical protein